MQRASKRARGSSGGGESSATISGGRRGEQQRWWCCSASEASWLVKEVEGDAAELVDTVGWCRDDGGYGYGGETAAAASAMASGERGREQGEE